MGTGVSSGSPRHWPAESIHRIDQPVFCRAPLLVAAVVCPCETANSMVNRGFVLLGPISVSLRDHWASRDFDGPVVDDRGDAVGSIRDYSSRRGDRSRSAAGRATDGERG